MRARAWGASALIYTVLTAILGRQVLARVGTTIANDVGDPLLTAAILHWNARHVPWSEAWWQFPIFHPTRDTLAFSEHLLGLSVIASPIAWITGNPLTTYNVTTLLTFPLSGLAMYALVQRLTGHAGAAFLAGLAYAFAPYRISTLPHVQMLASFWAPLALLGLHGYLEGANRPPWGSCRGEEPPAPRTRRTELAWLALFGVAWMLQAAANLYSLVLLSVLVALWALWFVVVPRNWRALGMIGAAMAMAAVPLAPILYRYTSVHAYHGFERGLDEMRTYSADVAAVLCAPSNLTVWGWIRIACRGEGELFPGVAALALFAAALWWTLRQRRGQSSPLPLRIVRRGLVAVAIVFGLSVLSVLLAGPWQIELGIARISASDIDKPLLIALAAVVMVLLVSIGSLAQSRTSVIAFYLAAAIVTWSLALGPTLTFMGELSGRPGPFALLVPLPGVGGLRVPARFWLMTVLCVSAVAGLFMAHVLRGLRPGPARIVVAVVAAALAADGWASPIPAQQPPAPVPDAEPLRGQVVLQLPLAPFPDIAATWRAVTGGWRSVNGYSGFAPRYYDALHGAARAADDGIFRPFQRASALHVIVADDDAAARAAVERQPGVVVIARRNGMTQYRLPRRPQPPGARPGERLPIAGVHSDCAGALIPRITDGDEETAWECLETATGHAITIDLGRAVVVGAVEYSQGRYSWVVPAAVDIDTSLDGVTWTSARQGSAYGELIASTLSNARSLQAVLRFAPREARYVRIRPVAAVPDEFAWFVAEVGVRAAAGRSIAQ